MDIVDEKQGSSCRTVRTVRTYVSPHLAGTDYSNSRWEARRYPDPSPGKFAYNIFGMYCASSRMGRGHHHASHPLPRGGGWRRPGLAALFLLRPCLGPPSTGEPSGKGDLPTTPRP